MSITIKCMKNKHLIKAFQEACRIEGIAPTSWARKIDGMTATDISTLPKTNLGREKMAILANPANWEYPKSAADIVVAALNDYIEDIGRSTEEFNVTHNKSNKANISLEKDLRELEDFARDNSGVTELVSRLAEMVRAFRGAGAQGVPSKHKRGHGLTLKDINMGQFDGIEGDISPAKRLNKADKVKNK